MNDQAPWKPALGRAALQGLIVFALLVVIDLIRGRTPDWDSRILVSVIFTVVIFGYMLFLIRRQKS